MIHYHGMPVSGPRDSVGRFLAGRHALVSHAYPNDIPIVADVCQSFVLDNGAFTVWKQGGELNVKEYSSWVLDWCKHPGFQWALIPDEIEGDEADNDAQIEKWRDAGLTLYGVPVWHLHESIDRLVRLCDEWHTVALGSSGQWATPGSTTWWERMSDAMTSLCGVCGPPPSKLHGLRMLNPKVFTKLPLSSADSTNASMNAGSKSRFGMYCPPTAQQRAAVIADRIESYNSAPVWCDQRFPEWLR